MINYAVIAILILNLIAFVLMGVDKRRAINGKERIPERVLLFWGFIMGGPGLLLGALVLLLVVLVLGLVVVVLFLCGLTYSELERD